MGEKLDDQDAVNAAAAAANELEHTTSLRDSVKKYPTAVFWAIAMSFTIGVYSKFHVW